MALSLTWGGRADTNVAFSEFFSGNHTVAARFMLQFVHVYDGPMLAVHGGGAYFIGNTYAGGVNNFAAKADAFLQGLRHLNLPT